MTAHSPLTLALWNDDYLTGDAKIDHEHHALFDMINALHNELHTAARHDLLKSMLVSIASHSTEHFQHEEALMQSHDYPGLERHQHVHNNLLKKVAKLINKFEVQHDFSPIEHLPEFLNEWLAHHIRGEDQNLVHFLRSR